MGVEFQSYVISKRLKLEVSAWSRFVEFLKLFKMLIDFKYVQHLVNHEKLSVRFLFWPLLVILITFISEHFTTYVYEKWNNVPH